MAGTWNPFNLDLNSAGLTIATTAYTAADQLGTEITGATGGGASAKGEIRAITLVDYSKIIGATELIVFGAATTPAADNAAASWSDADMDKSEPGARLDLPAPVVYPNNYVVAVPNLCIPFTADGSGNIYFDLITRLGHTFFGAVGDLRLKVGGGYWS